ncbi:MAG: right-handed parallel beta-helix repeat-containing protein, partial [Phycisphaerales bacterium]
MKSRIIRTIAAAAVVCAHALCLGLPGAFGAVYEFIPDQSTVTQTNFFGGIDETYSVTGHFGLAVDFEAGTARLGTVDAMLSDGPYLETRDLAEIFRMDELVATSVGGATVTFELPQPPDPNSHEDIIAISFVFDGDSVHITGGRQIAALGSSYFELDAAAVILHKVCYVDDDAAGANDGSSWTDAYRHLQDALLNASAGTEIRLARGVYKPHLNSYSAAPPSRTDTFELKSGVSLKGGYAGVTGADPDARDVALYRTVLSGDLDGNDGAGVDHDDPRRQDNAYHVVVGINTDRTTLIEGLTITAGSANGGYRHGYASDDYGGGMYLDRGGPVIRECTFSACSAYADEGAGGAGMYNEDGSPMLVDCLFKGNTADTGIPDHGGGNGAGLLNRHGEPTLIRCTFTENSAAGNDGGGFFNSGGRATLTDCTFIENSARSAGGGLCNWWAEELALTNCRFIRNEVLVGEGGGMFNRAMVAALTGCEFIGNHTARHGGAMQTRGVEVTLTSCLFSGNRADGMGGGLFLTNTNVKMANCTFSANSGPKANAIVLYSYKNPEP